MVAVPLQGEIWWAETEDKRRPVLVVTRSEAIPVLTGIIVAPLTRTIRNIPSEIRLGVNENLEVECAASFDNLQRIARSALTRRVGSLGPRFGELCHAIKAMTDC
ncbi:MULTISPECIES: type II toxin-antitoxin system PemK/MazF family toxin [Acidithrix]|uniref:Toxin MazF5 n=1 Tax=Acidithrix ferrooxidans TaxID=1280514 RepID=A0A0D8HDH1_9ACTN|nr:MULTISPECIES: type II toxin-antitoxin system PemK/MazF family toxin [Acidithrix]KJF15832.1 toxin MazF5 [Acidithrix ferrooxidans]